MTGGLTLARGPARARWEALRRGVLEARHAAHGHSVVWGARSPAEDTPSYSDSESKGNGGIFPMSFTYPSKK